MDHQTDQSIYTFNLRDGITFSNGEALTSEDVKASLEFFMRPESEGLAQTLRDKVTDVSTPDPLTVVVTTNPFGQLPNFLSPQTGLDGMVLPKDYMEEVGLEGFTQNPIGSGPYTLVRHRQQVDMEFAAVEDYWAFGTPRFSTLRIMIVPEEAGAYRDAAPWRCGRGRDQH